MTLTHILLISIITVGAHLAIMELINHFICDPDEFYRDRLDKQGKTFAKPLAYCPTCMASIWGTALHFGLGGELVWLIPTILAVAYVNTLLNKWVSN